MQTYELVTYSDYLTCTDICQATAGYQIATSATNLEICPANTYNDGSYTTCQTCPVGSYTSAQGSTSVLDCACQAGYFRNTESVCEACPVGEIKTSTGDAACSACPADMTTLSTTSTACVCLAGFEPNADNTACQSCAAGKAKYIAGNNSCIQCIEHATLQSSLPHQQSSCFCDPGYTGNHLSCSACDIGYYKSSYGNETCTACTEFATTTTLASTSITHCTCEALYEPHSDGGPDEIDGSCISSCKPGTFKVENACENCSTGFYKDTTGPDECTPCPDPRNSSNTGSDSINDCSCPAGEMALGGETSTIDTVGGFLEAYSNSVPCNAMPCSIHSNYELPLKQVTISAPLQALTVHVRTGATSLLVYACTSEFLCSGLATVPLPPIRAEYVDIVATSSTPSVFNYIQVHVFTHTDATFSNTGHAWWNLEQAQALITSNNMQPGESIFDSDTAVFDPSLCSLCAHGLLCAEFV